MFNPLKPTVHKFQTYVKILASNAARSSTCVLTIFTTLEVIGLTGIRTLQQKLYSFVTSVLCLMWCKLKRDWKMFWVHSFSTYAKFSEKPTFPIPWYAHVRVTRKWLSFSLQKNKSRGVFRILSNISDGAINSPYLMFKMVLNKPVNSGHKVFLFRIF